MTRLIAWCSIDISSVERAERPKEIRMIKIEFDTVNGAQKVQAFDDEIKMVSQDTVFDYMRTAEDGVTYGCEVDAETFAKIEEEYGVY